MERLSTYILLVIVKVRVFLSLFLLTIMESIGIARFVSAQRPPVTVLFRLCLLVLSL